MTGILSSLLRDGLKQKNNQYNVDKVPIRKLK